MILHTMSSPPTYNTLIEKAGYLYPNSGKPPEEQQAHNRALLERLYRKGKIDYIAHREDLTYDNFAHIKKTYQLSLARVNELHAEIKLMIEKKMTNVATKYLSDYMGFFTFRRNWRVEHGHSPANRRDAEAILCDLLTRGSNLTRSALKQIRLTFPKPSGRAVKILKQKTEKACEITKNKYYKYNSEDVPSFNVRRILEDAPRSHLNEIAKAHKIKGYTRMGKYALAMEIEKLDDIEKIIVDLVVKNRDYMIDEEDIKYLQDQRYRAKD